MKELGELVARLRSQRGYKTQKAFAQAVGKDSSWASRLEDGSQKVTPDPDLLARMSDVLGVPQVELLLAAGYDVAEHEETEVITVFRDDPRAHLLMSVLDMPDEEVEQWADAITAWKARRHAS